MRRHISLQFSVVAFACALVWMGPGVARAQPAAAGLQVSAPVGASIGDAVQLVATLTKPGGDPATGLQLLVLERVGFYDVAARDITVASAATGSDGKAVIRYVARREGLRRLVVRFPGSNDMAATSATVDLTVVAGGPTYTVEAPPGIPGVSRFALMALLAGVWGTMLVVAFHVAAIAREGGPQPSEGGEAPG